MLGAGGEQFRGAKQAADMMEKAMAEEGLRMIRVVGPQTTHRYHPDSKIEIDRMLICHPPPALALPGQQCRQERHRR